MSEQWCEYCRDHYWEKHFGEDGKHRSGAEFGPTGYFLEMAELVDQVLGSLAPEQQRPALERLRTLRSQGGAPS